MHIDTSTDNKGHLKLSSRASQNMTSRFIISYWPLFLALPWVHCSDHGDACWKSEAEIENIVSNAMQNWHDCCAAWTLHLVSYYFSVKLPLISRKKLVQEISNVAECKKQSFVIKNVICKLCDALLCMLCLHYWWIPVFFVFETGNHISSCCLTTWSTGRTSQSLLLASRFVCRPIHLLPHTRAQLFLIAKVRNFTKFNKIALLVLNLV